MRERDRERERERERERDRESFFDDLVDLGESFPMMPGLPKSLKSRRQHESLDFL